MISPFLIFGMLVSSPPSLFSSAIARVLVGNPKLLLLDEGNNSVSCSLFD